MMGGEAMAASRKPIDPMLLRLAGKSRKQDLEWLVAAGKITPAVRDKLARLHATDAALSLSLTPAGIDHFDALVAALAENGSVVPMGERTGPQSLALSRSIPVGDEQVRSRKEQGDALMAMTARAAGLKSAK
jgi:hypothetical protein